VPVRSSGAYGDFGRARRLGSLRNGRAGQIHRGAYCDAPSERWRPVVFARDPVCRRHERSSAPLDLPVPGREAAGSKAASSLVLGRTLAAGVRSSLPIGDDSRAGANWRRLNRKSCVPRRANSSARRSEIEQPTQSNSGMPAPWNRRFQRNRVRSLSWHVACTWTFERAGCQQFGERRLFGVP